MEQKLVKRFYCDHCRKGAFHKKAMERHEANCIHNPERGCWVCEEYRLNQTPMGRLLVIADGEGFVGACDATECPACRLAVIVQHRKRWPADTGFGEDFSYRDEMNDLRANPPSHTLP